MDNKDDARRRIWLSKDSENANRAGGSFSSRSALLGPASSRASAYGAGKQRSPRRNLAAALAVSLLLLAGSVMMTVFLSGDDSIAAMSFTASGSAKFTVNVVEGYTDTPIADARVVILETGKTYATDAKGNTVIIEVPVIRDTRFDKIIPKPWGEVSLIVYKDGFLPYALFYLQVMGGETRNGVKVLLFESSGTGNNEPFSIIEGPNRLWVDELVNMYKPAG